MAWPEVPCDGDVFHGLRELTELATVLEKRAYKAITQRETLEEKMHQAKQTRQGRSLSTRLARARAREATAIGLADEKSGEVVKLCVVKRDDSLTADELKAYCREELTGYKRPKVIEFFDELPKSNVGKILRKDLREAVS